MLRAGIRELWHRLESEPAMSGCVLIGGSAVALYLGHRTSEGLDFAYIGPEEQWVSSDHSSGRELKLPRHQLAVLVERLRAESRRVEQDNQSEDRADFASAEMELSDYEQDYLVDGVKMRVFTADTPLQSVLLPAVQGGVRLADLDELFASKALVSAGRSSTRDWFDLYHLMTAGGYTMNDFAGVFRRGADLTRLNLALHRLCSGRPDKGDNGFTALVEDAPTLDQITAFFVVERDRYERSLATDRGAKLPAQLAPFGRSGIGGVDYERDDEQSAEPRRRQDH